MTGLRKFLLLFPITALVAVAGRDLGVKCENPKCGYHDLVSVGGGFVTCKVTGYCTTCRKFVSIKWKTRGVTGDIKKLADELSLPEQAPVPVGSVWNPATSLTADLYPCPKCKKPFMEVDYYGFLIVPRKVTDIVENMIKKAGALKDDQIEVLMNASSKLADNKLMICPNCTNLTLRLEDLGRSD